MKKKSILLLLTAALGASAQVKTTVSEYNLTGPFAVAAPFAADTVDVQGKKFEAKSLLNNLSIQADATGKFTGQVLPSLADTKSVGVLTFYVNNTEYVKGKITVTGPKNYQLFIDGTEAGGDLKLAPEHHTFALRFLAEPKDTDSIRVTFDTQLPVVTTTDKQHPYMAHDLLDGRRVRRVSLSSDGAYALVGYQTTERGGNSRWDYELCDVRNGRVVARPQKSATWMPRTVAWIEEEREQGQRILYKVDPLTGVRTRWAAGLHDGSYTVSPTEDFLIVTVREEGPKEDRDVFEVTEMDDRQPGWRSRTYLERFDVATGVSQRLTFGPKGQYLADISDDGSKLLIGQSYSRLAKRPTEVADFYIMDVKTLKVDTLLQGVGFLGGAELSPDGQQILFTGTPEAFDRIGCQLPADKTPSMTENELFLYDIATRKVTPLTRDFDPSVNSATWSKVDHQIYFTAEDRDYVHMFTLNPKTGKTVMMAVDGDNVQRFDMAAHALVMAYVSEKTMEPASAYVVKSEKGKRKSMTLFDGKTALGDAEVGTCEDWNFTNSHGDTVYGRLYLPKDFDAAKKYPMIVYYYGGCSPVSRYFESRYPAQYWTSLGYVAYILQPSGATGFGQEWASRHVNTAGGAPAADGTVPGGTPAGDIIEGTRRICAEHAFIDATKIGCMGASYGGFMTMYLQTVTDIFAAAVSHAGIANHTSYWGEGYWGYNYSEVSMANSYPWSHRQLYVDQSPLFRADKVHTPLLLLHGNADTNVPLIESLEMFTALKLLGREVALVEVEGENHHILDYSKRLKWMDTQMAWFQKWLKNDPTWWDALYPKKNL
ncbi:MAG: S9 family peptidase [Prevotella sp.]|jgi:dipeptidyl aminopeptidase/acylaminoacyl peptidase|nr:S9 family peptidase [Prevotella sp.]